MKVHINGVDVEMACFNCFHWIGNREEPQSVGTCIAHPPVPFMLFVPKSNIAQAQVEEVPEIKSAWPPALGIRRCGEFVPFQMPLTSAPEGVTKQ